MLKPDEFLEFIRIKTVRLRPFLPGIAFFSGFTWDTITIGRMVKTVDLAILLCYYLGAGIVMILQTRDVKPQWQKGFTLLLQFFFGGLFSALVVFYFKSSNHSLTLLFVFGLCILLVTNEFLGRQYEQQTLCWTIFTLCGVMYFNFLIPHFAHSIHALWFYLSCLLSLIIVYSIRSCSSAERSHLSLPSGQKLYFRSDFKQMAYPIGVIVFLIILYQQQLIPPVPLVLKENYICVDLKKDTAFYQCKEEKQPFLHRFGIGKQTIHFNPHEKIYNLSSVYAPPHVKVDLEQHWYRYDKTADSWNIKGIIPVPMIGGRQNGWRTYSYINKTVEAGKWKVETTLKDGAILAQKIFILEKNDNHPLKQKIVTVH